MHSFEQRLLNSWPIANWADLGVLVAVSGGPDSVALLRALESLRRAGSVSSLSGAPSGRLTVAHYNHGLRGEASVADAQFVADLAQTLELPCVTENAAEIPTAAGEGLESRLRQQRYDFLQRVAEQTGSRFVVTAHTADDQAETILHRILRGTGLGGLSGIPRARPLEPAVLLRPLLEISRVEVLSYLRDLGQPCRQDESNADVRFTRNRLRHETLPQLEQQYGLHVRQALLRLGRLAGEAQHTIDEQVRKLAEKCVEFTSNGVGVACPENTSDYLLRELFLFLWQRQNWPAADMNFDRWQQLVDLLRAAGIPGPAACDFPGGVRAQRRGPALFLERARNLP